MLRQFLCGLRGHDDVFAYGVRRTFLRCTSCGRETKGFDYNAARPKLTQPGDDRQHLLKPALRIIRRSA